MLSCDCEKSDPFKTTQSMICRGCGIEIDIIYEENLSYEATSHIANPLIQDIHPSINKTLSELSEYLNMSFTTKLEIIDKAKKLINPKINYRLATLYAFREVFPEIQIDISEKIVKKISKFKIIDNCGEKCRITCARTYLNSYMINKLDKIKSLIDNGHKKGKTIDEILTRSNFPRHIYYKYKKLTFTHFFDRPRKYKKLTPEIEYYLRENINKTSDKLAEEILYTFFVSFHPGTIRRIKRTMK